MADMKIVVTDVPEKCQDCLFAGAKNECILNLTCDCPLVHIDEFVKDTKLT